MDEFDVEDFKNLYVSMADVLNLIENKVENLSEEVKHLRFFEFEYDKKGTKFERDNLLEAKEKNVKIKNIIQRFDAMDKAYNHTPWTMEQIYANLNRIPKESRNVKE